MMRRRPGFVTALVLIGLGVVFLLNNLGVVHIDPRALLPLWPILLILFAIEMLVSRTQSDLAYRLGIVWTVVVIVAAVGLAWSATRTGELITEAAVPAPEEPMNVPLGEATSGSLRAQLGSGTLRVGTSLEPTLFVSGTLQGEGAGLVAERHDAAGRANVTLTSEQTEGNTIERIGHLRNDVRWRLDLTDAVPLTLAVGLSSGRADVDLSRVDTSTFDLAFGMAQVLVVLPQVADAETRIVGTAGGVTVQVPNGVQVRIQVSPRLNSVDVGPGYETLSTGYQTAGLLSSHPYQQVYIELGAGRIRLR